ncbi:MAG: FeoA family protein [Thermoleophilia bacterium]|jgi:ferrous iron transport protein A
MITLAALAVGQQALVVALPRHGGLARRLIALGLTPGSEVRVVHNRGRGPLIVEAHGARIALGRGQAERVIVETDLTEASAVPAMAGLSSSVSAE